MNETAGLASGQDVTFLFDPACPWSWRASLWIRAAARVRPLTIRWELLSLAYVNRHQPSSPMLELQGKARLALRLLARTREAEGNEGVGRLYQAIGRARHEQGRSLDDQGMLGESLTSSGFPPSWVQEALRDDARDEALAVAYERALQEGAFGVPTIRVGKAGPPFYGPVIDRVPPDEESGALWDLISELCLRDYFFELKRSRA